MGEESEQAPAVKAFGTVIRRDSRGWFLEAIVDGQPRVVSRHGSRELAELASVRLNSSANRTAHESPRRGSDDR